MGALNLCRGCGEDFGSVSTFDRHRVGKHEYTYLEGLDMSPPREDGRRCLDVAELVAAEWNRDQHGRWRRPVRDASVRFAWRRSEAART